MRWFPTKAKATEESEFMAGGTNKGRTAGLFGNALPREIDENLKRVYRERLEEAVPDRFLALLDALRAQELSGGTSAGAEPLPVEPLPVESQPDEPQPNEPLSATPQELPNKGHEKGGGRS